jgi:16S rRNA (guanine527-N7)-methyltransferase
VSLCLCGELLIQASLQPPPTFAPAASALGIEFEPGDVEKLGRYLALLLETNKQFNLTAIKEPDEAWTRHVLDSLTLLPLLVELPEGSRVIDVGSGGGLPGIPLAIVMPHLKFTLLEATGKKAEFLRTAAESLGLKNVSVVLGRAERIGQSDAHREQYDAAVARAVGPLAVIAELTVPLVTVGTEESPGLVLLIKGQKADEELAAAKQALHELHVLHTGTIQTPTGRILVLEKRRKTPAKYPRKDGEPKRAPIGS